MVTDYDGMQFQFDVCILQIPHCLAASSVSTWHSMTWVLRNELFNSMKSPCPLSFKRLRVRRLHFVGRALGFEW